MIRVSMTGALVWALACGTAFAQTAPDTSAVPLQSPAAASNVTAKTPAAAAQNSIKLVAVVAALPAGAPWLTMGGGAFCTRPIIETWTGGHIPQDLPPYAAAFKAALESAGYKVITPGEDNLFDEGSGAADYEAAAVITDEHIDGCTWKSKVRGDSSMKIDWQIYSPITKQVVAHISTGGTAHLEDRIAGGQQRLHMDSFAGNVAKLASSAAFRAALSAPKAFTAGFQMPGQQSKIVLHASLTAGPRKIADAVGSVVTIMNELGNGSGVLVSDDGYVLTDAHVVGDDKQARVRWSDGLETLGQVVRVSKNRDVAILTGPRSPSSAARSRRANASMPSARPSARTFRVPSRAASFRPTACSTACGTSRAIPWCRLAQAAVRCWMKADR